MYSANSQAENTPTVVFSLGAPRELKFDRRRIVKALKGNKWLIDKEWTASYHLNSDSISIIHPHDENPLKAINTSLQPYQFRHGIPNVSLDQLSIGIAFRKVTSIQKYDHLTNLRSHKPSEIIEDYSKQYGRFMKNKQQFHKELIQLYHKCVN